MPKLFGVEVDDQGLEGLNDEALLKRVNDYRKKSGLQDVNEKKLQKYFLNQKDQNKLNDIEREVLKNNTEEVSAAEMLVLKTEIGVVKINLRVGKENEIKENKTEEKPVDQNVEENLNEKAENEAKKIEEELNKDNENKSDDLQSNENLNEKKEETTEDKKEDVKTEKKELASNEETDVKEDTEVSREKLDQETVAFAKNVEKVQKAQEKIARAAAGNDREMMQQGPEAYLKVLNDLLIEKAQKANRGLLPGDEILQYMQDVQSGKALNAQNNGALEEQMLEKRADTIQNIGEEYQQNKKLTPKLVEQMSAVDAIDNVLISITRNPKLLFITVLLMGLNPFMALGMAVLSAFGNAVVQDLYQKLPETDRSNLENRPAQEQQPAYNPQFEACQKELAEARKQLKDQEMMLQKYQQKEMQADKARLMRAYLAYMNSEKGKQAILDRINAEKAKMKPEAEAKQEDKKLETEKKQSVKEEVHKDRKENLEPSVLKKPEVKKEMKLEKEHKSRTFSMG